MSWTDGRGGARDGAGRKKLDEPKKAFRVTEEEKLFIKKMRFLDDDNLSYLKADLQNRFNRSGYSF